MMAERLFDREYRLEGLIHADFDAGKPVLIRLLISNAEQMPSQPGGEWLDVLYEQKGLTDDPLTPYPLSLSTALHFLTEQVVLDAIEHDVELVVSLVGFPADGAHGDPARGQPPFSNKGGNEK